MNMWAFETIALSVITLLLFLLMLIRKKGRIRMLLGALMFLSSIVSMILFLLMQKTSGNPDQGMELFQLYFPCAAYAAFALSGVIAAYLSRRTLQKEKTAKAAGDRKSPETI